MELIRTTDPDHEAMVQDLWRAMEKNGTIYEGEYEGWYCVPCEQFYTEKELDPGPPDGGSSPPVPACPVHKKPVDKIKDAQAKMTEYLTSRKGPLMSRIEKEKALNDSLIAELKAAVTEFKQTYKP